MATGAPPAVAAADASGGSGGCTFGAGDGEPRFFFYFTGDGDVGASFLA